MNKSRGGYVNKENADRKADASKNSCQRKRIRLDPFRFGPEDRQFNSVMLGFKSIFLMYSR